jgi:hypothetical protein
MAELPSYKGGLQDKDAEESETKMDSPVGFDGAENDRVAADVPYSFVALTLDL